MRSGDESKVSTHYFTQWGVTCRTAASAAFYTGMRPDCGVPGPKKFIYLADQGATVFRSPTPCFSVLNVRRRKRPAQKNNKQKKAQQQQKKKKNVAAVVAPTATMTQAQKIAGLRAVLKRHIKKPAKQKAFVDEPAGVEVCALNTHVVCCSATVAVCCCALCGPSTTRARSLEFWRALPLWALASSGVVN